MIDREYTYLKTRSWNANQYRSRGRPDESQAPYRKFANLCVVVNIDLEHFGFLRTYTKRGGAMRWEGRRRSTNVEDQRGGGMPRGMKVGGIGGVIVVIIALFLGGDPSKLLQMVGDENGPPAAGRSEQEFSPEEQKLAEFVSIVLKDTEDIWHTIFRNMKREYVEPKLVLFTDAVQSACGNAESSMGPFYCPGDQKVYIDLAFYRDLKRDLNSPGEFAQAYVIAHEIGHHVQNLLGISDKVHEMRSRVSEGEYNRLSVRLELQADFLAGVWAHHEQKLADILDPGDIEAALNAASNIGDDRLQQRARGYVVPESFTHGSSEQRVRWFKRGFESGDIREGDTFAASRL